jgi:hypothetical protein
MQISPDLLSLRDVAARYGVSYAVAYNHLSQCAPALTLGRTHLFSASDVAHAMSGVRSRTRAVAV